MEKTINEVFKNRTDKYKDKIAVEKKLNGRWESASWQQYYAASRAVGLGLNALGINRGDRVSILSENRLEWLYADMGTLGVGAVVVPIYTTLLAEEVGYVLKNSGTRTIFVEDRPQLEKVLACQAELPELETIILINKGETGEQNPEKQNLEKKVMGFREFSDQGQKTHEKFPDLFDTLTQAVSPTDLATIVYTSGTTGRPKGVMISHKNIMAVVHSLDQIRPTYCYDTDQVVPFLPLSHVYGRLTDHFFGMYIGVTASYAESILLFARDVKEKRPHVIQAVPRICEKVYHKILEQVDEQPLWKQKIFHWGQKTGVTICGLRERHQPISFFLSFKYRLAYLLVFKKLAQALGGRVRWMTASGAPTSRDIILFFNAAGITVVEGYGMTECCAPATMSRLDDYRIGTVGNPLPGVEIKIAADGEILIKGDNVFAGYWNMEEATKEAFDPDGYLLSGDIGEFENNFLRITDRKKDLIITSGGKNIAPQKIEGLFKFDPLFEHVIVIGEGRKYLTALLNLNPQQMALLAEKEGISQTPVETLLDHPDFLAIVDRHVADINSQLARYETIKQYRILRNPFSSQTGELTASLKLKRNVVLRQYQELIESMYPNP